MIVRKILERDDCNQSEVIDIPATPPFLRVLDLFPLGGEETVDGGGLLRGDDVIADGSAISERVREGWMTCLRRTSVADCFLVFSSVLPISE